MPNGTVELFWDEVDGFRRKEHGNYIFTNPQVLIFQRVGSSHHLHDAWRILGDAMSYIDARQRRTYTEIIGSIQTLERGLRNLEARP
ncbi:MAG TPA: hypothetical protein VN857_03575 [Chthoniobacterales bacterium]|jgi:hypothetical protein|nr:hypothetical protein [Chthoniobacterales bacterium]